MRLIPVIDLRDGLVVHAVKGEREHYRPVKSVLCKTPDPFEVAGAFRDQLALNEIYVADLDSIQDPRRTNHREVISALALRERMNIILDAGVSDAGNARTWLDLGVDKVVIGSETLRSMDVLRDIPAGIDRDRLVFSLDFRSGKILSQCPALAAMPPMKALGHLQSAGWREVILLDLSRVGSGEGMDRMLAREARSGFPDLNLLIGGGISKPEELAELKSLGIAGALIATAFHRGIINAQHLSALSENQP
jgi:phosphoribosylformimino-5-aminoimidazole carboxamide ribotide isomerase